MLLADVILGAVPGWVAGVLNVLVMLTAFFLIVLVLIQRGKGGGLAGAFGGVGGSSAFGSRAGDTFTRITIGVAAAWILLIMVMVKLIQPPIVVKNPTPPPPVVNPEGETRLQAPDAGRAAVSSSPMPPESSSMPTGSGSTFSSIRTCSTLSSLSPRAFCPTPRPASRRLRPSRRPPPGRPPTATISPCARIRCWPTTPAG